MVPEEIDSKFKELRDLRKNKYSNVSIVAVAQARKDEGAYQSGLFACSAGDLYFIIGALISKLAQSVDKTPLQVVDELKEDIENDDEQFMPSDSYGPKVSKKDN